MTETTGFIGLGIMGKPMAHNLLKAGYSLIILNRHPEVTHELVTQGARVAESPQEVTAQSRVVITMLPDSPQVEEVIFGPHGILEGAHVGLTVIDMSTISSVVTQHISARLAKRGIAMLDAPVSGGDKGAIAGTLSIMVGGNAEVFSRCLPLFHAMGKTIIHVGASGAGQVVKSCNQIVVALTIEAVSEALVLGSKAGVDPAKILQVLSGGLAANKVMELRGEGMRTHTFTPGFRVRLHHKDLGIALGDGRAYGVPLPVTALVDSMFGALEAGGRGDLDHSTLLTFIEGLAHHSIVE